MEIYNKAIRDKIPEIIKASGKEPKTRQLPNAEFLSKLEEKLVEELKEYQDSKSPEELADILEVIYRIGQLKGSDLEKIRIKKKGSDGGHNGLTSIIETLATEEFPRLRFGIGGEFARGKQVDYVLGKWSVEEEKILDEKISAAVEAIKSFMTMGIEKTMTGFNKK